MTTVSLNNLWTYIQSLSLSRSNREWLASKLIEPSASDDDERKMEVLRKTFGMHAHLNESYPVEEYKSDVNAMSVGVDFMKELL